MLYNNFDCQRNTRNRSASRRIILSISKTRVFIFAEKYSIFYSPRMSKKKWIHWNQRCVEISTCIHIRFLAILKREKEWPKQRLLPQIPPSDWPENSYQSSTPGKKSTLLRNKNALLLSRESNSLAGGGERLAGCDWAGVMRRWRPAAPDTSLLANTGKRAHAVSANIGPRFSRTADVLGYGRPRRAPNFRARACVCARVCIASIEIERLATRRGGDSIDLKL